jgi:hypothetical protein
MQPSTYSHTAGYKSLMTYVIYQALLDLRITNNKRKRDSAKEFLLSDDAELFCEAIGFNDELLKNIDFDNVNSYLNFNANIDIEEEIVNDDYSQ